MNDRYLAPMLCTLIVLSSGYIIKIIGQLIIKKNISGRKEYVANQTFKMIITILEIILLFLIWINYFSKIMTLISVLSGAIAIALRDIILNLFCGFLITTKKMFRVEDRIEINGVRGDVMNINALTFDILEVSSNEKYGQSTGVVITFPNSVIFNTHVKNYNKGLKYIWNELVVKINPNSNLEQNKKELYNIIQSNEVISSIPKKMKREVSKLNNKQRVYFNEYNPIIYMNVKDNYIELYVRYLMHPKKARYIESELWEKIYQSSKKGKIDLYCK